MSLKKKKKKIKQSRMSDNVFTRANQANFIKETAAPRVKLFFFFISNQELNFPPLSQQQTEHCSKIKFLKNAFKIQQEKYGSASSFTDEAPLTDFCGGEDPLTDEPVGVGLGPVATAKTRWFRLRSRLRVPLGSGWWAGKVQRSDSVPQKPSCGAATIVES